MQQPTQPDRQPTIPAAVGVHWCAWHEAYSNTASPVRDTSGAVLHACYSCRQAYDLVPVAERS
ncbi:hypothetical protein [Streptomyces chartreusis]|uniref:hypothetical protein n=1 Tax=Streptomyces chartreusis TaxID=1969 RepID=UPI003408E01A